MSDVSDLIVARSEEIVANIVQQMEYAKLDESALPAGIICIGGGSKLNGMLDLLKTKTSLSVKKGQLPQYIHLEEVKASASELIEVSSVLYVGAMETDTECLEIPQEEELPATGDANQPAKEVKDTRIQETPPRKRPGFIVKLTNKLSQMFSGDEDDSDLI
jgi:cell division ATPase FtsA